MNVSGFNEIIKLLHQADYHIGLLEVYIDTVIEQDYLSRPRVFTQRIDKLWHWRSIRKWALKRINEVIK